jgi:rubredoxin
MTSTWIGSGGFWTRWVIQIFAHKDRKGTSTLTKWSCPECGLNVRIGIKGDPELRHEPCEQKSGHPVFIVQADGLTHTIYEAEKGEPETDKFFVFKLDFQMHGVRIWDQLTIGSFLITLFIV